MFVMLFDSLTQTQLINYDNDKEEIYKTKRTVENFPILLNRLDHVF
jgi:hypothetical protein